MNKKHDEKKYGVEGLFYDDESFEREGKKGISKSTLAIALLVSVAINVLLLIALVF